VILLLVIPFVVIVGGWDSWRRGQLRRRFLATHESAGKRALLVYSNSPNWQSYIEREWIPRVADHVVLLNWSERATWSTKAPLESVVFRRYAGDREFNPIAIVFKRRAASTLSHWLAAIPHGDLMGILFPSRADTTVVRFWQPFRDFKHGKDAPLRRAEAQFFESLGIPRERGA
jgi:hypothetical protein